MEVFGGSRRGFEALPKVKIKRYDVRHIFFRQ